MKAHNDTATEEGGNLAYMALVAGLGHHRHTRLDPKGLRPGCLEPEAPCPRQLPRVVVTPSHSVAGNGLPTRPHVGG
jgi:hypothetical protein